MVDSFLTPDIEKPTVTGRHSRSADNPVSHRRGRRGRRRRGRRVLAYSAAGTSIRTSSMRPAITARPSGVNVSVRYWRRKS
jgi:hypothetical protein